jgi:tetratricopeptide (TPR) repeat protein
MIHFAQGSFQQAIPAFEQAIKLGVTDRPKIYIELGLAYANQSRCDLAIPNLQKAQSLIKPDDQESLNLIKGGFKLCPNLKPTPTSSQRTPTLSPTTKP